MSRKIPRSIPVVLLAAAFAACGRSAAPDPGAALQAFAGRYLAWRLAENPDWATAVGEHRYDDKLPDMSAAAVKARVARTRTFASELSALDASKLNQGERVDREMLFRQMALDEFLDTELQSWRRDPLAYTNIASDAVYNLIKRDYAPLESRLRSAVARMQGLTALLEQARANLEGPSRIKTEVAISQTRGAVDLFRVVMPGAAKGTAVEADVSRAAGKAAEAMAAYADWLEKDLLPRSVEEWRLGPALYDRYFELASGSTMKPLDVLKSAEADYEAVLNRMRSLAVGKWSSFKPGVKPPKDPDEAVRLVIEAMAEDHPAPGDFIPSLKRAAADLGAFIREKHILDLPEPDNLSIEPVPDFQAGIFHGQLDQSPPLSGDGPAVFSTSGSRPLPGPNGKEQLEGFLREFNSKALIGLITHEGYPGHYVQGRYAARSSDLVRKVFVDGAYVEGWACYCERMMVEEGFRDHDPGLELQMLKGELKMTANAILDIRLHRGMMKEEEIMPLLVGRSFQTVGEARDKIVRAKGTAIQLSTYYIGFSEMMRLRRDYQAAAGAKFDLAEYHRRVLEAGAPPMRFLRELVLHPDK